MKRHRIFIIVLSVVIVATSIGLCISSRNDIPQTLSKSTNARQNMPGRPQSSPPLESYSRNMENPLSGIPPSSSRKQSGNNRTVLPNNGNAGFVPAPSERELDLTTYLNILTGTEKYRRFLLKTGLDRIGGPYPEIEMAIDPEGDNRRQNPIWWRNELVTQYRWWLNLLNYISQIPAPSDCRKAHSAYVQFVYLETKSIGDLAVAYSSTDFSKLEQVKALDRKLRVIHEDQKRDEEIQVSARTVDRELSRLAEKNGIEIPFEVCPVIRNYFY